MFKNRSRLDEVKADYKVAPSLYGHDIYQVPALVASAAVKGACTNHNFFSQAKAMRCMVLQTGNSYSDRSFAATVPHLWNNLPPSLPCQLSYEQFEQQLKTFLSGH